MTSKYENHGSYDKNDGIYCPYEEKNVVSHYKTKEEATEAMERKMKSDPGSQIRSRRSDLLDKTTRFGISGQVLP